MAESAYAEREGFKATHVVARGEESWQELSARLLDALHPLPPEANLGFLYATDRLADDLENIAGTLSARSGVAHWVGTVGIGIATGHEEIYDRPALVALVASFPPESFRMFRASDAQGTHLAEENGWIAETRPVIAVVHGDPRQRGMTDMLESVAAESGAFLLGGIASSRSSHPQLAPGSREGGVSGVMVAPPDGVVAGLTQGCTPIGERHEVTDCDGTVLKQLDGRPALNVLKEDIGELLARDLRRIGGYVFAAFPVAATDTGDYVVRNLIALDEERSWVQVAELLSPGMQLFFCRRDHQSALRDLERMLGDVARRSDGRGRAALYFTCLARGRNLFGGESEELRLVQSYLGDIPLAGFFCNGEICNNRLYTYTGVLAVFT